MPTVLRDAGGDPKSLGWKYMSIDWRRGYVILSDSAAFQPGIEGYKRFSLRFADRDMKKCSCKLFWYFQFDFKEE